jgi:hypothetical protein
VAYVTNDHLHAGFQLNRDGEVIGLFSPGGVAQHMVVFGPQTQNVSQGLFPDGVTNIIHSMTNWTPASANTLAGPLALRVVSFTGGGVTLEGDAIPGRHYSVEFKDDLADAAWQPLGGPLLAAGSTLTITDGPLSGRQRFYRIKRLD